MAGKFTGTINKLQKALIHTYNEVYFINNEQFFSASQHRVITMFVVSHREWNEEKGKFVSTKVLKTAAQLDVLKYLANKYDELGKGETTNE